MLYSTLDYPGNLLCVLYISHTHIDTQWELLKIVNQPQNTHKYGNIIITFSTASIEIVRTAVHSHYIVGKNNKNHNMKQLLMPGRTEQVTLSKNLSMCMQRTERRVSVYTQSI